MKQRAERDKDASLTMDFASLYTSLKEYDKAIEYLEEAFEEKFMLVFMKVHPLFEVLKDDPRFISLMDKVVKQNKNVAAN